MPVRALWFENRSLFIIDQRALPRRSVILRMRTLPEVAEAIRTLAVRGAPSIGVAAAYGMVLAEQEEKYSPAEAAEILRATRPTAFDLFVGIETVQRVWESDGDLLAAADAYRAKVVEELVDQWIVQTEALATKFPQPTAADVTLELQTLLKQFPSRADFQARLAQIGMTQDEVREVIERQLYYIRFLDYKFHAATEVTSEQIESYYQQELEPQLQKRGLSVPPLNQVEAQIRQLLTQEEINEKATQWLEEAKARLRIAIQPPGGGG